MRDIRFAAAQFEHRDGHKAYNLGRIRELTRRAAALGAEVVCFHECSVTAYTFLQTLDRDAPDTCGRLLIIYKFLKRLPCDRNSIVMFPENRSVNH